MQTLTGAFNVKWRWWIYYTRQWIITFSRRHFSCNISFKSTRTHFKFTRAVHDLYIILENFNWWVPVHVNNIIFLTNACSLQKCYSRGECLFITKCYGLVECLFISTMLLSWWVPVHFSNAVLLVIACSVQKCYSLGECLFTSKLFHWWVLVHFNNVILLMSACSLQKCYSTDVCLFTSTLLFS